MSSNSMGSGVGRSGPGKQCSEGTSALQTESERGILCNWSTAIENIRFGPNAYFYYSSNSPKIEGSHFFPTQ